MAATRIRARIGCVLAGVAAGALAVAPGAAATLRGRVVDGAKGLALPGATVRVQGTALRATADRDGGFTLADAPEGTQTLVVDYVGYGEATMAATAEAPVTIALAEAGRDEIVVTGNRLAERRALQTKRAADNAVEALYANDVGKLPDQNVAEAVRRLPGLSVANDQGEGRYVIIRGINPNLVNVVLNGQTLPAPEPDGRQVKLDDIPSALISSVVVTKSLTPDQDGNAIGGEVNIRTLSAFDRNRPFFLDARGAYGLYKLNKRRPWEADGQLGGVFGGDGQFGAVLSVNYSRRPIESENFQGTTNYTAAGLPDQFGLRDYTLVRTRLGVVGNLDWHPSDAVKLFLRTSYSRFTDNETRDQNRVDSLAYPAAAPGTFTGRGSILVRRRIEKDNTRSAQAGGDVDFGDAGHLAVSGSYTRAVKNDPLRSEYNFRTASTTAIAGTYDLGRAPYLFAFPTFNPAGFPLNSVNYDRRHAQEDLWQGRADYTLPIGLGDGSSIKLGGKYLDRHKTNDRNYVQYGRTGTFNASSASYTGDTGFYDGEYAFGPRIGYDAAQAFVAANPVLTQSAGNINTSRANSQVNDYDVRERIAAGYAMATLKFGALTLVPGVRVEHTADHQAGKLLATGAIAPADQPFNSFTSQSYTDVLPGLNAHYDVGRSLVFRGAITTALGRPNYPDLTPYVSVDTTASPTTIALGNPNLKRYRAVNLDASAEYYLPSQGVLSIGLFWKHLDNPIYTQGLIGQSGTFGGQAFANVNVKQAINARDATVRGVEVNAQVQFTFLPAPFDGLGVSANYTRIGGHASGLPGRAGRVPLFLQSRNVGTAQLFYEKSGVALRIAYSFRSAYVDTIGASAASDQYTDYNGQLDVHASYQIGPHFTLFADGTNLNDAPWRRYIGVKSLLVERERYDYSVRGGVQLHF